MTPDSPSFVSMLVIQAKNKQRKRVNSHLKEHRAGRLGSIFLSGIERRKDISISSMHQLKKAAAFFFLVALSAAAAPKSQAETRYLLFQIFTSAGSPYQALGGTTTQNYTGC